VQRTLAAHEAVPPGFPNLHLYKYSQLARLVLSNTMVLRAFAHRTAFRDVSSGLICNDWRDYHMPPAALDRSNTVTLKPSLLRCAAATTPLMPAPTTAMRFWGNDMLKDLLRSGKNFVMALRIGSVRTPRLIAVNKSRNGSCHTAIAVCQQCLRELQLLSLSAPNMPPMWR
jgi:hypothetical protein